MMTIAAAMNQVTTAVGSGCGIDAWPHCRWCC
jgi:hypothetical protein